jgi:NADH:ubiquinone oxidoreductase subunit 5 (subunit L)/multisubunit Na+/H+ antiporter MnhA subunit
MLNILSTPAEVIVDSENTVPVWNAIPNGTESMIFGSTVLVIILILLGMLAVFNALVKERVEPSETNVKRTLKTLNKWFYIVVVILITYVAILVGAVSYNSSYDKDNVHSFQKWAETNYDVALTDEQATSYIDNMNKEGATSIRIDVCADGSGTGCVVYK